MTLTLRWFGHGYDTVTLEQIRQIPGVTGIVTSLYGKQPGEVWDPAEIAAMLKEPAEAGLPVRAIESVNVHDAIKTAAPDRDQYIDRYITTLENLGRAGVDLVCYNFMAVFDWTRSDLARLRSDGSRAMAYDQKAIDLIDPADMSTAMNAQAKGYALAGWEPERLAHLTELFARYKGIDRDRLFANLKYFLERVMPVCERYGIRMAMHPDDPAWSVFGLPRIQTGLDDLLRLTRLVDTPLNGVTLCTGSLATNPANDIPAIVRALKGRVHFVHLRNIRRNAPGDFEESAHLSADGSLDMRAIVRALRETGFDGLIRPDHGRAIWGEKAMPGYGLYDRALGAAYIAGLWEGTA